MLTIITCLSYFALHVRSTCQTLVRDNCISVNDVSIVILKLQLLCTSDLIAFSYVKISLMIEECLLGYENLAISWFSLVIDLNI